MPSSLCTSSAAATIVFSLMNMNIPLFAQSQKGAGDHPEFEVASIKLDKGAFVPRMSGLMSGGPGTSAPGRINYTQASLKAIVRTAYAVASDQIYGPSWLDDPFGDKFTINATMPSDTTRDQLRLMLQDLLADRFHLVLHHEMKEFPAYNLVVAAGGPRLKEWVSDPNASPVKPSGRAGQGFPQLGPSQLGSMVSYSMREAIIRSTHRQTMADFAKDLGTFVNRSIAQPIDAVAPRIADKTELSGIYEFNLEFEGRAVLPGGLQSQVAPATGEVGTAGPTIFSALEKQLGLKLVKSKNVPVDVLVIDQVDRVPTEN